MTTSETSVDRRYEQLRAELDQLRQQLVTLAGNVERDVDAARGDVDDLRSQIGAEVRTRRVVVVGPDGFERITAEAHIDTGEVLVRNRKDMHVALVADESDTRGFAEVFLSGGGNGVGRFGLTEQGAPDFLEYDASLGIYSAQNDPRFHDVSIDREGLHFGG